MMKDVASLKRQNDRLRQLIQTLDWNYDFSQIKQLQAKLMANWALIVAFSDNTEANNETTEA